MRPVSADDTPRLIELLGQLNEGMDHDLIARRAAEMMGNGAGMVFGLYAHGGEMIGCATGWITDRIYCGRQAEIDNVIVDSEHRSQGLGAEFLRLLENWAVDQKCLTVELNSYVDNVASHRFYEREGYHWLGRHYQKVI